MDLAPRRLPSENLSHHSYTSYPSEAGGSLRGVATFNVGGRTFEIQPHLVRGRGPSTLLASLLDDIGTDGSRTIFVDANPDRFQYILDWYRHGEMYIAADCPLEGLLRDARYFMLPDFIKVNGATHSVRPDVVTQTHDMMRQTVISKWPSFYTYIQRLINETRRVAEDIADKSHEVDTDMLESPWDCSSESASTHPQHSHWARIPDRKMTITKEFVLAEVARVHDADTDYLEVQSMAPMFMFNEAPAAARWRWVDEQNVCNELRLRVLKAELERLGLHCIVHFPRTREHAGQRLILRLDMNISWSL